MSLYRVTHFVRYTDMNGAQITVPVMADNETDAAERALSYLAAVSREIEVWKAGEGPFSFKPKMQAQ